MPSTGPERFEALTHPTCLCSVGCWGSASPSPGTLLQPSPLPAGDPKPPRAHRQPQCPPRLPPLGALASLPRPAMSLAVLAEQRRLALWCLCKEFKRCTKSRLGQLVSVRILRLVSLFLNGSAKLGGNFSFLFFFFLPGRMNGVLQIVCEWRVVPAWRLFFFFSPMNNQTPLYGWRKNNPLQQYGAC